jgi:signal transduction histidine kinase
MLCAMVHGTPDDRQFSQLVLDLVRALRAQWRSKPTDAAAIEPLSLTPNQSAQFLEILEWLAAAATSNGRSPSAPPEASENAGGGRQSRDHFVGMLAHDLQTPLNAIILTAAAELRRTGAGPELSAAERVLRCAERMKRMTMDLLDFARARSGGGLPVRPENVDLARLAREAVTEVEESHPGCEVLLQAEGDVQGDWDPARITQVLVNLLCNAVHHGGCRAPVDIRLVRQSDSVRIDVVNQAEPIPESEMTRLFEPFARGRSSRSRPESVGLGLFIVSEIVAAHGGEVMAFNSPQAGTVTFSVRLPLHSAARE